MSRNDILKITEKILKILKDNKEYSVNQISNKLKIQWKTSIKALEFLKRIDLVKERKGKTTHKTERLFSLKN